MEDDVKDIVNENFIIKEDKKQLLIWRVLFIVVTVILVVIVVLYACGVGWKKKAETKDYESILSLWKEGSESKKN